MKTSHQIVAAFKLAHKIDTDDLNTWLSDNHIPEDQLNIHDSRYLEHLETYVSERDAGVLS